MSDDRNDLRKLGAVFGSLAVSLGISTPASAQEVVNPITGPGPIRALESAQMKAPASAQGKLESVQIKIESRQQKDRGRPLVPPGHLFIGRLDE